MAARSIDACEAGRSTLSSSTWGQRPHAFLHRSASYLGSVPQKQKLKLYSSSVVAGISPTLFQYISDNPASSFQASREKTCLEFVAPVSTGYRIAERWVCYGGGKRPRKPRIWRSRHRRGSFDKSDKLLQCLESVSNVKEEVYGALDAFIAWELDFPLIPVKKALFVLEQEQKWARIIQVIKWMLGKGQGKSLGNYHLLLRAFSEEGRIEEAQELWKKVFDRNLECTPIKLFAEVMRMYHRYEMYEDLLEVFADMEELNVRLNEELCTLVSATYEKVGSRDKAEKVRQKYVTPKYRWHTVNGKIVRRRIPKDFIYPGVSRWTREGYDNGITSAAEESGGYGSSPLGARGGEEEDVNEYGSEQYENMGTEVEEEGFREWGEEDFAAGEGVEEPNTDIGHFDSRPLVRDEVYI